MEKLLTYTGRLDLGDIISIFLALLAVVLFIRNRSHAGMSADSRTFVMEMLRSEKDKMWALLIILIFLYAIMHTGHDPTLAESFKTLVAGAVGWIGNMLTNAAGKKLDERPAAPDPAGNTTSLLIQSEVPARAPHAPETK